MKSLVTHLSNYVEHLFNDLRYVYRSEKEWMRDRTRLLSDLESHGSFVMTLALPAIGKHLDKCISEGLFSLYKGPMGSRRGGSRFPALGRDLIQQIFTPDGILRLDAPVEAVAATQQLFYGCKAIRLDCKQERVNDAVREYESIEAETREYSRPWGDTYFSTSLEEDREVHLLDALTDPSQANGTTSGSISASGSVEPTQLLRYVQRYADIVAASLGDFSQETDRERPRHGPGAVSNLRRGVSKYSFPQWSERLEFAFPHDLYARTDLGLGYSSGEHVQRGMDTYVPTSRLIAVPKTQRGPRLIASEPVEHQWIQQLLLSQIENRLRAVQCPISNSIHFRSQLVNQQWAVEGSRSSGTATIDLSSASDRLSCWAVERIFRSNRSLLVRLNACRTTHVRNSITNHWDTIQMKKFAPQGSAVTFPLQSVAYAIICASVVSYLRDYPLRMADKRAGNSIRIFGDDLIVPVEAYGMIKSVLEYVGLKVNTAKTYSEGNFRESCGVTAFRGHDVTPAYLRVADLTVTASSLPSIVEVSNNFHKKGMWSIAKWITSSLEGSRKLLPFVRLEEESRGFSLGLYSFCGARVNHLKKRWNPGLHRTEYRVLNSISKDSILPTEGAYRLFQYFIEAPDPLTKWVSGTRDRSRQYSRIGWLPAY